VLLLLLLLLLILKWIIPYSCRIRCCPYWNHSLSRALSLRRILFILLILLLSLRCSFLQNLLLNKRPKHRLLWLLKSNIIFLCFCFNAARWILLLHRLCLLHLLSLLQELQLFFVIFAARLNDVLGITIFFIIILTIWNRPSSHHRFFVDYLHGILIITTTATAVIAAITIFTLIEENVSIKVSAVVVVIRRAIQAVILFELSTHVVVVDRGRRIVVIIHSWEL